MLNRQISGPSLWTESHNYIYVEMEGGRGRRDINEDVDISVDTDWDSPPIETQSRG